MRAFDGTGALPPEKAAGALPPEGAKEGAALCADKGEGAEQGCGGPFKPLSFAGLALPNNVLLAPMAGYTDLAYRRMCIGLGAGLTFTEMVSSKGLLYDNAETKKLLRCGEESPKAAQLFGSDPEILRAACESELLAPYDLIDLNMGCPMPKIVKNGEGSALLENRPLAKKVISACVKSGKRISVKFRIGVKEGDNVAAEFAKLCEGAGACLVTVHGRVRERIYAGEPDYKAIAEAKDAVKIPVIANGGVWNRKDAEKMLQRTGADGVMIARAALYRPQTFSDILGTSAPSMGELFFPLLDEEINLNGERFALLFLRKMAAFWCKGVRGAAEYKRRLFAADSIEALRLIAEELFGPVPSTNG